MSRLREGQDIAELCKGSTSDSDSLCSGSNPDSAAIEKSLQNFNCKLFSCLLDVPEKI